MIAGVDFPTHIARYPVVDVAYIGRQASPPPSLLDLPHRCMTHSGRSALFLALRLAGVGKGDGVLVPTYHCPTMIAPVERLGALAVFYRLTESGAPDVAYLARLDMTRIRAMVAAHFFGVPVPLSATARLCAEHGVQLIEDCAHCFFGRSEGDVIGTVGHLAVGSLAKFFPVRSGGLLASLNPPTGELDVESGPLTAEIRAIWDAVDMSSRTGRMGVLGFAVRAARRLSGHPDLSDLRQESPSEPSGSEIRQSAVRDPLLAPMAARRFDRWLVKHSDLNAIARKRSENFRLLATGLEDMPRAKPLAMDLAPGTAPYVMPLLIDDPDEPYQRMRCEGLPVFRWDRRWPGTPDLQGDVAGIWSRGVVQLACHQSLRPADIDRMISVARSCLR